MENNRGKRQAASIFGGMGFYIALLVCVIAAGVVGYFALLRTEAAPEDVDPVQNVVKEDPSPVKPVVRPETKPARPVIAERPVVVPQPSSGAAHSSGERTEEPAQETAAPVEGTAVPAEEQPAAVWKPISPLAGETAAVFSVDELTYDATLGDWRTHDGVDIRAAAGTPVVAAAAGTVLTLEEDSRLGVMVTVDHHNGYVTTYASLHPETLVAPGDSVSAGEALGAVGNTSLSESALGAHLHFAISKDGAPVDPEEFLE